MEPENGRSSVRCAEKQGDNQDSLSLPHQLVWLFVIALPVAGVSWTLTAQGIFAEPREYLSQQASDPETNLQVRKLCHMLTCRYCLSHYVTLFFLFITRYKLLLPGWRGYLMSFFAVVWVANVYTLLFSNGLH
jgi:hypothetical protein